MGINDSCPKTWKMLGTGGNSLGLHFLDHMSTELAHNFRISPQGTLFHKIFFTRIANIQNRSQIIVDTDIPELARTNTCKITESIFRIFRLCQHPGIRKLGKRGGQTRDRTAFLVNGNKWGT